MTDVQRLQGMLAYSFADTGLLQQALTHRSASQQHNERLEFLGDAMLGVVVAEALYQRFTAADEGQLTRLRAAMVRRETLAAIAGDLRLGEYLQLGEGELKSGGHRRESILANAAEALIGALYLDGGFEVCRQCILRLYEHMFARLSPADIVKDPKTELQEWLQARGLALPVYRTLKTEGEPHEQRFTVECALGELIAPVQGEGRSRRLAEQLAAARALADLKLRAPES